MRPLQRLRACARSRGCSDPCCHAHGTMACSTSAFMHASAGVTATAWCSGMADVGRNLRGSAPELGGLTALRLVEGSLALEGLRFEEPEQCWSSGCWLIVEFCSSWCLERPPLGRCGWGWMVGACAASRGASHARCTPIEYTLMHPR